MDRAEQLRRAEEAIDRALRSAPGSYVAHYTKGKVLQSQKKTVEAIAEYEAALRLNPNAVGVYARIGLMKSYTGHPEDTFKYLEEATRRSPKDRSIPFWYYWAGLSHLWLARISHTM
jgi:tetratricopeptide (TPR) repeat protein